jgi:hypothetical protein
MNKPAHDAWYKTYRWQKLRARHLASSPLCVMCEEEGRATPATICDHVEPHRGDPEKFWSGPFQSLCKPHHDGTKQSLERYQFAAANHPEWLRPSAIPLTIVCGPPASGKTTYVRDRAKPGDVVIDLDGIMTKLRPGYTHWADGGLDKGLFNRAVRERNQMLGSLSKATTGQAWFIVSAPTQQERAWWHRKLGGKVVLLHPGADECKRRAKERGTPNAIAGVDRWEAAARQPWTPARLKPQRQAIGLDGWPTDATASR